ncbi:hypothetical protein [Chryseobacterium gleum]|uniref:hypothetical protein n=1 Tax=Chryseobacterium gleum TaxID=250 RepID=UPI00241F5058|nr:hypothetical protein [Chryseobacterium gleum]
MHHSGFHTKTYKAVVTMLILVFSLSPCSVKRIVLDIFDIEFISGLNKVKTTSFLSFSCDVASASSDLSVSKIKVQNQHNKLLSGFTPAVHNSVEEKIFLNIYSGHSTGNSPPKYILFKRLKLNLI